MKAICGMMLAGLVGSGAWAQEARIVEGERGGVPAPVEQKQDPRRADSTEKPTKEGEKTFIGKAVYDEQGRELGRVEDVVMDLEKGEMGYAIIQVKGEEDLKLPVPASALKAGADEQKVVLDISEKVLAALEVYRDKELPAPNAFSVDGEAAVGGAATSEQGGGSSEDEKKTEEVQPADSSDSSQAPDEE